MKNVVITGADRNLGLEMTRQFLQRGWRVFAGRYLSQLTLLDELQKEYPDTLHILTIDASSEESVRESARQVAEVTDTVDIMLHNAAVFNGSGGVLRGDVDYEAFVSSYNINCLGAMRMVQAYLPLMQKGMKRLCFVSSEAGAVGVAHRTEISGYCMSKTALNMALRLMFNQLQPMGYTFRLFHPGWVRSTPDGKPDPNHPGKFEPYESAAAAVPQFIGDRDWEDRMVLIDNEAAAWPF